MTLSGRPRGKGVVLCFLQPSYERVPGKVKLENTNMLMRVVLQEINSSFIVTVWSPSCTRTQQERRHDSPRVTRWGCGRVGKTGGQRYVLPNGAPETTGDLRESPTVGYRCCPDRPDPELRLGSSTEPTNVRLESKRPGVDGLPYLAGRTLL